MSDNQTIVGGYELKNCVASGASTQIWEVVQQGGTAPFAMKLLLPDALKNPEAKNVLKHEFKVGSALEHPNIVRLHRIEFTRDHGFFIMDYFRAPSLKAQISANLAETQGRFKRIAEAVCQAFVHMNEKGWMHRDIKPDNILVNKTGEIRVIDFSLATRVVSGLMKLLTGKQKNIMGTRTYIAPELILKNPPTIQSDIYSLGVTFFEIITGVPPFAGMSPSDLLKKHIGEAPAPPSIINPNVTSELDAVVLRMLAKKPKDRPADMREVMSLMRNVKCFKEDPFELHERKIKEGKANESLSVDKRLDSRADADRVSRGLAAPAKPVRGKRLTAPIGEMEAVKKTTAGRVGSAPAAQPSQGVIPGGMAQVPFGIPGQPMPFPPMMMPVPPMVPVMPQYPVPMPPQPMLHPGAAVVGGANQYSQLQVPTPLQQPSSGAPQVAGSTGSAVTASGPGISPGGSPQQSAPISGREKARGVTPSADADENLDFMTELPDIS